MICKFHPEWQKRFNTFLFFSAQASFLLSAVLGRISLPWLPANIYDFTMGFLTGYCIVAWLGFLAGTGCQMRLARKGKGIL